MKLAFSRAQLDGLGWELCSARWLSGLAACQPGGRVSWGWV